MNEHERRLRALDKMAHRYGWLTLVGDLAELAKRESGQRHGISRRNWHWAYVQLRRTATQIEAGIEHSEE